LIFDSIIQDPLTVGDLRYVIVKKGANSAVLWHSSDPNDFLNVPIRSNEVVLVVDIEYPYIKVVTPIGVGWIYAEDTKPLLRHN
jgi:hypothetical protein